MIEFTMPGFPDSPLKGGLGGIEDTPEIREAVEDWAIPKCRQWREANPEPRFWCDDPGNKCPDFHDHPSAAERAAPYCCSAYCARCTAMRILDGEQVILPNEWMTNGTA